jgi:hypothetical protein
MNVQRRIDVLRIHLLATSRLSQRALDYSIKGYEFGNLDICSHVCHDEHELREHHFRIGQLCRQLMTTTVTPSDFRFVLATLRLNRAFHAIYRAAVQITQDTTIFLKASPIMKCPALDRLGEFVNCAMRLCIIALFKKDAAHAEMVLQSQGVWRRCELVFDHSRNNDYRMEAHDVYALAIARNLGVIAKQAHVIADSVLFWLKGSDDVPGLEANGQDALNLLFVGCSTNAESAAISP